MRRAIFKREIGDVFKQYSAQLEEDKHNEVLNSLFINPFSDESKQFLLKDEISSIDILDSKLKEIVKCEKAISDIKSIFLIDDDLKLPPSLRKCVAKKRPIAIFVGAGVSKLLHLPLWTELADSAIEYLHRKGLLTFYEKQTIKSEPTSPRQKLSIFHKRLEKGKSKEFYEEQLIIRDRKKLEKLKNPYDILVGLECPKISTNLDNEFCEALFRKLNSQKQFNKASERKDDTAQKIIQPELVYKGFKKDMKLKNDAIYQIHGSIKYMEEIDTTVITMSDYLNKYYDQGSTLRNFLMDLFNQYTVIFIGYGLEEFEVLENCVKGTQRHYALVSSYLSDTNLFRIKKQYFDDLGIEAVPYYLDFYGYERLYDVLSAWVNEIRSEIKGEFYSITGEFADVKL